MELKYLSDNWQYTDAGLEEAYHIVYYIPSGYRDTTNWTERIKKFKWGSDVENDQLIIDNCVEAISDAHLEFDYVIRMLGSSEVIPLPNAKLVPLAKKIAETTSAMYLPCLLRKKRATTPLHNLSNLAARKAEMDGVFEIENMEGVDLNNKKILIVDDISTAFVTSAEMIKTLKTVWPNAIFYLFCIARTNYDVHSNQRL